VSKKEIRLPLSKTHPELAAEAEGWNPAEYTYGSGKMKTWKCLVNEKHIFEARILNRTLGNSGCPYCGRKKVLAGDNDLYTTHPNLAAEAYGWDPTEQLSGSNRKLAWKCKQGHIWKATIYSRTSLNSGCSVCSNQTLISGINDLETRYPSLAKEALNWDPKKYMASSSEALLWKCNEGHEYLAKVKYRTRNPLGEGCPFCTNRQVLTGFNDLLTKFPDIAAEADGWDPTQILANSNELREWKCSQNTVHRWQSTIRSRREGFGCGICSGKKVQVGVNDLLTTHPALAAEADGWDPTGVTAGSGKKVNWKCKLNHTWSTKVNVRGLQGSDCPYCANHELFSGYNDFQTRFPSLSLEADGWDASKVMPGSSDLFDWKCSLGHKWRASLNSRTNKKHQTGCPSCSVHGYDPNKDGWLYFLSHSHWEMLQIGITNVPDDRLGSHRKLGWEVLELRGPMDGHLTAQWETAILRMLKANGADLSNSSIAGKFDGYSEAWSNSTFPVKSIKELMRLTEEFEEKLEGHS
jgi:hypothetical protein